MSIWDNPAFELEPLAHGVGPFPRREFLRAVAEHHRVTDDSLRVATSSDTLLALQLHQGVLRFVGDADLVDYRSPLGDGVQELTAEVLEAMPGGTPFEFDSLPLEAAEVMAKGASRSGAAVAMEAHASTMVLHLPSTFDDYLHMIGKKERHELRRKRRRYEDAIGEAKFVHSDRPGPLFDDFVRFHRMAAGDKGSFMTSDMERFFASLVQQPGWGIDALVGDDGHVTAAAFGYQGDDGYYLYNSSYDPELADASPGVVLLGRLIELTIERGKPVFDFLKGDERYKHRMGAEPRSLFRVSGATS